jgi:WD40 repeat protein
MDLKGHSSQVMAVAFNPDGTRAITASKDGTLRIWKTDVRYALRVSGLGVGVSGWRTVCARVCLSGWEGSVAA